MISSGKGGIATINFGLIAIFVPFILWFEEFYYKPSQNDQTFALYITGISLIAILTVAIINIYAAFAALRAQPPIDYADIALSGKSASEIFRVLAYETKSSCQEFLQQISKFEEILESAELQDRAHDCLSESQIYNLKKRRRAIRKNIMNYNKNVRAIQEELSRLLELKRTASMQLDIPQPRLCEHILQYSPRTHQELAQRYKDLWEDMYQELRHQDPDGRILSKIVKKIKHIRTNFENRVLMLSTLFENSNLHEFLHNMASKRSTSGAINQYALALSAYASAARKLVKGYSGKDYEHEGFTEALRQLRFLYRKQRAYPGFEIHHACSKLCGEIVKKFEAMEIDLDKTNLERQKEVLSSMKFPEGDYRLYAEGTPDDHKHEKVMQNLDALEALPDTVQNYLSWSRGEIAKKFVEAAKSWLESFDDEGELVILTHGYSGTIRDVLSKTWSQLDIPSGSTNQKKPKVFIMHSDQPDLTDTRIADTARMAFELRNNPENHGLIVATGNEDALLGLLNPQDRIMVVLGAEAYDAQSRVVHPRGALNKLKKIKAHFQKRNTPQKGNKSQNIITYALAEDYKRHDDSLIRQYAFFTYHLGHLDVYPIGTFDKIIGDTNVTEKI